MKLRELDTYLKSYLEVARFDDSALNGIQVEGRSEVRRMAVAVSVCAEVIRKAAAAGADALLVHHGLLWKGDWPRSLEGITRERLALLLQNECSLLAFHLPLDAHGACGNNAVAARALGLGDLQPFGDYHGSLIGWRGRFPTPLSPGDLIARLEAYYGHKAHAVLAGPEAIETVGIISGGAAREAEQAAALGLHAYVTGEPGEPAAYLCREAGMHFAALGHYATERVGVKALAEHLQKEQGIATFFIEVDNEA